MARTLGLLAGENSKAIDWFEVSCAIGDPFGLSRFICLECTPLAKKIARNSEVTHALEFSLKMSIISIVCLKFIYFFFVVG